MISNEYLAPQAARVRHVTDIFLPAQECRTIGQSCFGLMLTRKAVYLSPGKALQSPGEQVKLGQSGAWQRSDLRAAIEINRMHVVKVGY